jgi:vancomycin permeability regulator SanA
VAEPAPPPGRCAVLVLGYPSRADGTPSALQRERVAGGIALLRARGCERLVLSGGAVENRYVEAETMARVAAELGAPGDRVALEPRAVSTWENVALSLPLLAGYDAVLIASEPFHARRAVRYVCRQRAELCARAFAASPPLPWRLAWLRVASPLYELRAWVRDALFYGA